ncbi:neck protein [Synechococcus phage S-SZBM1]|uniref:Neck protein n=1 Tax=Synechococcus phage S-SZBM1 TaxID=2926475 RepID=A0AC61TSU3_9CAUD|nr:head closure Hc2 [Synechococcus phage S-SZBM1]UNH61315.1 neck protein [Synechococcus phage S-SZBM1]
MALNPYFTQGTTGEQSLIQDLVDEQIKMFGKNVYYIPRTLVKEDSVFGEDTLSKFEGAFEVEVYLEDAGGFRGDGDIFSKFGVRIQDQVTFILSRRRFTQAVDDLADLIVEGRPNEGDLIHFPLAGKTFEIQYVEHEVPFFQLGKMYVWGLRCELFEYSDEDIETGIDEVDALQTNFANAITVTMADGGTGDYEVGELVTASTTGSTAEVKSWDSTTKNLIVINRTGAFSSGETVTGNTSSAVWTTLSYNTINNVNDEYDDNYTIEVQADEIIDFTQSNPFGEYGNKGGVL